jgi:hypothetical protein
MAPLAGVVDIHDAAITNVASIHRRIVRYYVLITNLGGFVACFLSLPDTVHG